MAEAAVMSFIEPSAAQAEDVDEPALARAIASSLESLEISYSPKKDDSLGIMDDLEDPRVTAKRVRKKLKQIANLEGKVAAGAKISREEKMKIERKEALEAELTEAMSVIDAEEAASAAAIEDEKVGMKNVMKV